MARLKHRAVLPEPGEKAAAVDAMFDTIAPRYDRLNRILTLGLDVAWRRAAVRSLQLRPAARVLDIACGTGDFCREIEKAGGRPIGLDRSSGMLAAAGLAGTHAPLVRGDGLFVPARDHAFDGVTCGFALRNVVALEPLFAECARVLKPGGRFAFLEVAEPERAVVRAGTAPTSGTSSPSSAGCSPIARRTDTYRTRPRTSPGPTISPRALSAPGSPT